MRSIRRRLTSWLLGGLAVLWLVAATGVYWAVQHSLVKSIDAELAVDARTVRFAARGENDDEMRGRGAHLQDRLTDYQDPQGESFFQIWASDGRVIERSLSLGESDLSPPVESADEEVFETQKLETGREVRTMTFRISSMAARGPGKGKGRGAANATTVMLAKDLKVVRGTLSSLLGGLVGVGLLAAAGAAVWVGWALRHGLRPLAELSESARDVDAASMSLRFDAAAVPAELKPVYAALNALLGRLERAFERERRFTGDLAHEMRTPVAELRMLSEVALKWPDEAGTDTHAATLEIAQRLESTLESLRLLARWEAGEAVLQVVSVNVAERLREAWRIHVEQATAKGLRMEWECDDEAVWETDAGVLQLVIGNLLSNAAEYAPSGGRVWLRASAEVVEVANDAPDLDGVEVERLFERFWRADLAHTGGQHSGLGLALAREGAQALGMGLNATWSDGVLTLCLKKR